MYAVEVMFKNGDEAPEYFEISNEDMYAIEGNCFYIVPVGINHRKIFSMDVIHSIEIRPKEED